MNNAILFSRLQRLTSKLYFRTASNFSKKEKDDGKTSAPNIRTNFSQLQGILSKMKVDKGINLYDQISKFGNSDMFNYATNKLYDRKELKTQRLEIWCKFLQYDIDNSISRLPLNGFQEMILLTEQGKMWKYPIDNEQDMDAEKETPFEDHVFLDHFLKDFPQNEYIQSFMGYVVSGLARNYWITVDRKHEIIRFYKEYFNEKCDIYKEAGFEI